MEKQLITQQLIKEKVHHKSGCSILLMGIAFGAVFTYVIFSFLITGLDLPINLLTLGISLFSGISIFVLNIVLALHSNKKTLRNEKEYYIVEDVLLSKRSELAFRRGFRLAVTLHSFAKYEKAYILKIVKFTILPSVKTDFICLLIHMVKLKRYMMLDCLIFRWMILNKSNINIILKNWRKFL